MSQRLSTSVTFQNLEDRVSSLEQGQALTQSEVITALGYTPANISGDSFVYLNARTFIAFRENAGGSANLSASSVPGYTGIVEFRKSDGTRSGFVGFNTDNGPMNYGSDTGAGHYFQGGVISPDPNMHFGLRFNSVDGIIDFDANDYLYYSRSNDEYLFMIGGSTQLALSSGGLQVSNVFTVGDGNFGMSLNGSSPYIAFDNTDFLGYNRSSNTFSFNIGDTAVANLTGSAFSTKGAVYPAADSNFSLDILSGVPTITFDLNDAIRFDRAANKFYFQVGGVNVASIDASGNMRLKGTLTQSVTP